MAAKAHSTAVPRPTITRRRRAEIEAQIEQLIAALDALDGDPDLEPSLGAPEVRLGSSYWGGTFLAPPVGSAAPLDGQQHWARGHGDDDEAVNEDGGDVNDEPQDANTSEDCEPDPEPRWPNGSHISGGGSGI